MINQNNTITNSFKEQAQYYLNKMGWNIILVGKNKKPFDDWKEYQTKKVTPERLKTWFILHPEANIAVITGKISNLTVVDIDPRHDGSYEPFKDIQTIKSKTGGGGYHIFFQFEEGLSNKAGIQEGIDIRSEAGYVILPPSSHKSGNNYEWIVEPEAPNQLVKLPSFIKNWTKKISVSGQPEGNWNNEVLKGVGEGQRNETATSVVGKLLKRFPEREWNTDAWQLFVNWNDKNKPPLEENELRSIFESIKKKELQNPSHSSGTETPHGIVKVALIQDKLTYQQVEMKAQELLPNSQTALKLVLAVTASSVYANPVMIWLLLVGVPSSGKTEMVRLVKDADCTYYLDNLTQNAFVSGERSTKNNKVYDLLPCVDKKCLIIKDWTSIFSLDEKMTKKLLGDLVGIYDKEFTKFSSRRGNISYSSTFSQLGCITPSTLNKHTNYMNMVGPRFLCYSMPSVDSNNQQTSYDFIFSDRDRSLVEKEARKYVSSYISQIIKKPLEIKTLSSEGKRYLRLAAELMSNCRGIVILQSASFKNEEGNDVKYYEVSDIQIEEPWRALQQLIVLSRFLAFVVEKDEVGIDEFEIIKEVVISSMPADRSQALRMIQRYGGMVTAKQLADLSDKSIKTSRRLLDELSALKVLDKNKGSGAIATDYKITERFSDFILYSPAEFLSHKFEAGNSIQPAVKIDHSIPLKEQLKGKTVIEQEILTNLSWENTVKELEVKNRGIPIT